MKVYYETRGEVAVIQIDHPPVNGLGHPLRDGIAQGIERALDDPKVRAIAITGTGRVFSGGADIREFGTPAVLAAPTLLDLIVAVETSYKPVISAINGVCMGGGLELSLACHYRLATPAASLGLPEVRLGLVPGAGGTQRLPRAVGKSKAMDLVLTGRFMDAAEAERAGLVARVVPAERLMTETLAAAATICALGMPAVMMAKECVNRAFEGTLADGVAYERRVFHSLFATDDQKEGMDAFLNKRAPRFRHG